MQYILFGMLLSIFAIEAQLANAESGFLHHALGIEEEKFEYHYSLNSLDDSQFNSNIRHASTQLNITP